MISARQLASAEVAPFPSPTPTYAGFENPPVVGALSAGPYGATSGSWKRFEYGVHCIDWASPCQGNWADLVTQSRRFQESRAEGIVEAEIHSRQLAGELTAALEGPYESWFHEDYLVLHL